MTSTDVPALAALGTHAPDSGDYDGLGSLLGDRRDGRVYVADERIRAATRVALATRRPLLLRGPAGSGKSSLAPFMARVLGRRFYTFTVTARTQARDLLWQFDALRRLSDAQVRRAGDDRPTRVDRIEHYIEPGAMWWAFDAASASRRGLRPGETLDPPLDPARDPGIGPTGQGTVILIDEIDKADPDLPNNLLEPLGSLQFTVQETGRRIHTDEPPLVFITTNDERELPAAFYRRCAVLFLKKHDATDLVRIASAHFATHHPPVTPELAERVALKMNEVAAEALRRGWRPPSTAEYLDAVRACLELGADPRQTGDWEHIEQLMLSKQEPPDVTKNQPPASA